MKTIGIITVLAVCIVLAASVSHAAENDAILGTWDNEEKDAKIDIIRCGDKFCGMIVWLKNPNYPPDAKDGVPGTPRLDHNNPDENLKNNPILGLEIVRDFAYTGDHTWAGGRVYDPKNGKTYRGKMTLAAPNRLELRGYVGIPLFGRSTTWTRYVKTGE